MLKQKYNTPIMSLYFTYQFLFNQIISYEPQVISEISN